MVQARHLTPVHRHMSDIFISYARPTAVQAQQIADALRALGYGVWLDDDLPVHRAYARVIPEQLTAAKAVVVLWSTAAIASQWVASEANRARSDHKLVQLSLDGEPLPMPFDQIQCADMNGWNGDINAPGWRRVVASIDELVRGASTVAGLVAPVAAGASVSTKPLPVAATKAAPAAATGPRRRTFIGALLGIAVLGAAATSYLLLRKSDRSPEIGRASCRKRV